MSASSLALEFLGAGLVVVEGFGARARGNEAAKGLLRLPRDAGSESLLSALRGVPELSALLAKGSGRSELSLLAGEGPGGSPSIRRVDARAYSVRHPWPRSLLLLVDVTENAELLERLSALASKDPLTGLYNRRRFDELGVLMLDIDLFKRVNDEHGHELGDLTLKAVAAACLETLRSTDILARYGGEEFAVFLPGGGAEESMLVAERLRARVAASAVSRDGSSVSVTVSVGVYAGLPGHDESLAVFLRKADEALYRSKAMGRNKVSYWEPLRQGGSA